MRLGAVSYLNARPLTWSLDGLKEGRQGLPADSHPWQVRYDLPSVCAGLLARNEVDLALVSSVEYLSADDYRSPHSSGAHDRT